MMSRDQTNHIPKLPAGEGRMMVTTSWTRKDSPDGQKRFTLYAIHVPVAQDAAQPERFYLSGNPVVIGSARIKAPNLEVAKILANGIMQMLAAQPPEIITVKG